MLAAPASCMTDLDADSPATRAVDDDEGRPGVWRVLSLLLVAASAVVVAVWILQSRSASDLAVENSRTLDVEPVSVFVDDIEFPPGARVAVLGIDDRAATPIGVAGTELDVPTRAASLVALLDDTNAIHGLSLVSRESDRSPVVVSPGTTAHALLALSPMLLDADLERTRQRVESIEDEPAVVELAQLLAQQPDITAENEAVEIALAAILDRVPTTALPDQGCDSILNARALAVAGTCAEPASSGVTIHNEQDRWVLAFSGPEPYAAVCAAIAPAGTPGSQRGLSPVDCGPESLLVAPGPIIDRSPERTTINARILAAAGVQLYAGYAAPFADLAGGAAGLTRTSNSHILASTDDLVVTTTQLADDDRGYASALDVLIAASTPVERHAASIAATRIMLDNGAELIDDWDPSTSLHGRLLDFYDRVGERMLAEDRTEWRWTADAWGVIALEDAS